MDRLQSVIRLGVIKQLAPTDAQGAATLLGVGAPKNSKTGKARLFQVQVGPQLKTAQLIGQAGEDVSPTSGSLAALLEAGDWLLIIAAGSDVPPDPNLNQGERTCFQAMATATDLPATR